MRRASLAALLALAGCAALNRPDPADISLAHRNRPAVDRDGDGQPLVVTYNVHMPGSPAAGVARSVRASDISPSGSRSEPASRCQGEVLEKGLMRIYFVGSHATGKTTLCRYISRKYGLPMITEVARAVLAEMEASFDALRTDMDLVAEYQAQVFARQVAVERLHDGHFVSDRAFDNLAYAAEHTTIVADLMASPRFAEYMKWVSEGIVFFLRPHASLLREDGVRAGVTWESVLRIDGMVKLLLEQHRVSYLPVESVSMQERVRAAEFVLSREGLQPARGERPALEAAPQGARNGHDAARSLAREFLSAIGN
jgi:nicotinamide riboside kinase